MLKHKVTEKKLLYAEISRLEKENDKLRSENERLRSNFKDIENYRNLYNDLIIEVNRIKENYKKKNCSLVAYFIMCNHSNSFCNLIGIRKLLLGLEL